MLKKHRELECDSTSNYYNFFRVIGQNVRENVHIKRMRT